MLAPGSLFCARCTGFYLGLLLGAIALARVGTRWPRRPAVLVLLALGPLSMAVDGVASGWLYHGSNTLRVLTGALAGAAMPAFTTPILRGWFQRGQRAAPAWTPVRAFAQLLLGAAIAAAAWGISPVSTGIVNFMAALGATVWYLTTNLALVSLSWRAFADRQRPGPSGMVIMVLAASALAALEVWLVALWKAR